MGEGLGSFLSLIGSPGFAIYKTGNSNRDREIKLVDRSAANVKKAALGSGPMTLRHARARHPRTRGFTKPILRRVRQERTPEGCNSKRGERWAGYQERGHTEGDGSGCGRSVRAIVLPVPFEPV